MELAAARHEGFVGSYSSETNGTNNRRRLMAVIGVITEFGRKNSRDAIRRSWLPTGIVLALSSFEILHERNGLLSASCILVVVMLLLLVVIKQ